MQFKNLGILFLLIFVLIFTATLNPAFLSDSNIKSLIRWTSLFGFCSIGVAFVIITGGIDLSIGSVIGLSGCLVFIFLDKHWSATDERASVVDFQKAAIDDRLTELQFPSNAFNANRDDKLSFSNRMGAPSEGTVYQTRSDESGLYITLREPNLQVDKGMEMQRKAFAHRPMWLVITLVMLCSLGIGLLHGLLITKGKLQPFVVTLCGLMIYRGLARVLTGDKPEGFESTMETTKQLFTGDAFSFPVPLVAYISRGDWSIYATDLRTHERILDASGNPQQLPFFEWVNLPVAGLFLMIAAVIAWLFLNRSIWGRYLLALGNNEQAVRFSGIATHRMVISAYVLCSLLAGFTGILFVFDFNGVEPSQLGNVYEMYAIAAAVIGGCSLRGGTGSIFGVIIGTAVMRSLFLAIGALQIPNSYEFIVIGSALLLAVVTDEIIQRTSDRRRLKATRKLEAS